VAPAPGGAGRRAGGVAARTFRRFGRAGERRVAHSNRQLDSIASATRGTHTRLEMLDVDDVMGMFSGAMLGATVAIVIAMLLGVEAGWPPLLIGAVLGVPLGHRYHEQLEWLGRWWWW
jgi:hypothetical protein